MIVTLMNNPKAGAIYANIPATMAPVLVADAYLQAKLAGDADACIAYEAHARDLARLHFQREDVRECLAAVERYKAMRKPGKNAPRMFQDIAGEIERAYAAGDYQAAGDGRIVFTIDRLRVTCKDLPGAVALVCAKYRRGIPRRRLTA